MFCSECQTPMMYILPDGGSMKKVCIKCQDKKNAADNDFLKIVAVKEAWVCPERYWVEHLVKCGVMYCKRVISRSRDAEEGVFYENQV